MVTGQASEFSLSRDEVTAAIADMANSDLIAKDDSEGKGSTGTGDRVEYGCLGKFDCAMNQFMERYRSKWVADVVDQWFMDLVEKFANDGGYCEMACYFSVVMPTHTVGDDEETKLSEFGIPSKCKGVCKKAILILNAHLSNGLGSEELKVGYFVSGLGTGLLIRRVYLPGWGGRFFIEQVA